MHIVYLGKFLRRFRFLSMPLKRIIAKLYTEYIYITHTYIDIYVTIIIWVVPFTCQKTQHDEFVLQNKSFSFVKWCMFQFMMDLISFHVIFCDGLQLRLSEPYEMQPSILNPQRKKYLLFRGVFDVNDKSASFHAES